MAALVADLIVSVSLQSIESVKYLAMGTSQSKTIFSSLVCRLRDGLIEEHDSALWDEFWKTTLTAEVCIIGYIDKDKSSLPYILSIQEIFQLLPVESVREAIDSRRPNVVTLFTQAVAQLYQVVETPYPVYFDQALNCSRVLARVVPILLEKEDKHIRDMFWARQVAPMKGPLEDDAVSIVCCK